MDNRAIGLFDSGVGGLTVLSKLNKELPNESTIYFGDTANFPYGNKSGKKILNTSKKIVKFLKENNVKIIIIACNTISSNCYDYLKDEFKDIPIIEIVSAGVEEAIKTTQNFKIGIIATKATIDSLKYQKQIISKNKDIKVFSSVGTEFASFAEEDKIDSSLLVLKSKEYLQPLIDKDIDTLVLGCTHYPILIDSIKSVIPTKVKIVDPSIRLLKNVKEFLLKNDMFSEFSNFHKIYVSKESNKFNTMCGKILGENKKIDVKDILKT